MNLVIALVWYFCHIMANLFDIDIPWAWCIGTNLHLFVLLGQVLFLRGTRESTIYGSHQNKTTVLMQNLNEDLNKDILLPYSKTHYDPKRTHRHIRDCQPIFHGNTTFETHKTFLNRSIPTVLSLKYITHRIPAHVAQTVWQSERFVHGHLAIINNPMKTFSVYEPLMAGSCTSSHDIRSTVVESSIKHKCIVATNAGFFNTHDGGCLGNIISDGKFIQSSHGIQNANFGMKKDGSIIAGYLSDDDVLSKHNNSSHFLQLISGVGWLLRNGEIYLDQSKKAECADTEETGTIERFFNVISGRTAIGHDKQGRIIIAHVDGKTDKQGMNLYEFAAFLKQNGVINAINLDGGGSSTFVVNGTVINYPSDGCGKDITCARKVSTIICIHDPVYEATTDNKKNLPVRENKTNIENKPHRHSHTDGTRLRTLWFLILAAICGVSMIANVCLVNLHFTSKKTERSLLRGTDFQALLQTENDEL